MKSTNLRLGQAFANVLLEFDIKLDTAFDCFYKDSLLPLAMNEVRVATINGI